MYLLLDLMSKTQIDMLHDQLWEIVEFLQRINMIADIDEQEFKQNNARCKHIKEVIQGMNNENKASIYEAKALVAEYLDILFEE